MAQPANLLEMVSVDDIRSERARRRLIPFAQHTHPRYQPAPHHDLIAEKLEQVAAGKIDRLMIFMPPRHGKALAVDTPIATPDGWRAIGSLIPGDTVFDEQGKPTEVVAVSPVWTNRPVYRVRTDDGDEIIADAEHEWVVRLDRKRGVFSTRTTEWLARRTSSRNPMVQAQGALDLPERDLTVDPYVLGVWLGDGRTNSAAMCSQDDEIIAEVATIEGGYNVYEVRRGATHFRPGPHYRHEGVVQSDTLQARLRRLGVLGNKHIPTEYLRSSRDQRLSLLQGLVDTDGYVSPNDGQVEVTTISLELALGIKELVHTLGHKASIIEGRATLNGRDCGPKYRVMFYMAGAARLSRKAERCRHGKRAFRRYITIEPAGTADTVCIQVASERHMFLCGRSMLPTHNSELSSVRFPAWYLGRHPERRVILTSYAADLSYRFSRQARNIITDSRWPFPDVELAGDAASVRMWDIARHGGGCIAAGVGGPITGQGAHLLIIDDPVKNAEEADSETYRNNVWEWYQSTAYTRLEDGGAVVLIMCMTGDTPVLMADGTERPLRDIKIGDCVATYEDGKLATATVLNHRSNGPDRVFKITTTCGKIVHANERHPFLVQEHGQFKWIRLRDLTTGHRIVTVRGSGESGRVRHAPSTVAISPLAHEGIASRITTRKSGPMGIGLRQSIQRTDATSVSSSGTGSPLPSTMRWPQHKTVSALSVNSHPVTMCGRIGAANSVLTTATKRTRFEGSCATTATLRSATPRPNQPHSPLPNTCDFTTAQIESIEPAGVEEVFDIQVERTENFIANGLVSHNTRWHHDDLAGRLLAEMERGGDQWDVVDLPAVDADGRALWPEKYDVAALERIRAAVGSRAWTALYQQRPTDDEGAIIRREWWRYYDEMPDIEFTLQVWDTAFKAKQTSDYSVCATWGRTRRGYYLLGLWRDRVPFPDLKRQATRQYELHRPNAVLIEDAASGQSLIQELQRETHLPVAGFRPDKDKVARVNAVTPTIEAGRVYLPQSASWLPAFIEEHAQFPNGAHDDQVDTTSMALLRLIGQQVTTIETDWW